MGLLNWLASMVFHTVASTTLDAVGDSADSVLALLEKSIGTVQRPNTSPPTLRPALRPTSGSRDRAAATLPLLSRGRGRPLGRRWTWCRA